MNLQNIFLQFWQPAIFSFTLAVVLIVVALKLFPKLKLMDRPHKYGLDRAPIPYYGGLTIYFAFLISLFVFVPLEKHVIGLLIGSSMIMVLGFFDDLFSLSPWFRLGVQFLAAMVLVIFGIGILSIKLPFIGAINFDQILLGGVYLGSALFTVLWVMTILNTMNFVDGVSGLVSGVTFVAGLTIFLLSVHPSLHENPQAQLPVALIALIISMVSLAFLLFDFPAAKILMGDTGSTFLGFMLASLAIFSGGKVATAFLVLGIPILDMIWVILRRTMSGKKFWQGDLMHLHHRLLNLGFSRKKVVLIYLFVTALFGFSAVALVSTQQKFFMIIALGVLMLLLAVALVTIPNRK